MSRLDHRRPSSIGRWTRLIGGNVAPSEFRGELKAIQHRSTAYIMDEVLIAKTFSELSETRASLPTIVARSIALLRSIEPALGDASADAAKTERSALEYVQSKPASAAAGGDERMVMMQAITSSDNVRWLIEFARDSADDAREVAEYNSIDDAQRVAALTALIAIVSSPTARSAPIPDPVELSGKVKRAVAKRERIPARYDETPLRERIRVFEERVKATTATPAAASAAPLDGATMERERAELDAGVIALSREALNYWMGLVLAVQRRRAEELAYRAELELSSRGCQREIARYLSDKRAQLAQLRPLMTKMLIMCGAVFMGELDRTAIHAIDRLYAHYAPRVQYQFPDGVTRLFLDLLRLERGVGSETKLLMARELEMPAEIAQIVPAELTKRSAQLRFLMGWLLLVE